MKLLCTPLALLFLLFTSSFLEETGGSVICNAKCARRCAKASFHDRCHKYCVGCCEECRCVPSGTYGNKDECPCYRDKLNSKKQPKCP